MSDPLIKIPRILGDRDLTAFFKGWRWLRDPTPRVTLDFREVEFLAPWAVALFANYILWLSEKRGAEVRILYEETTAAGRYLVRSGFAEMFGLSRNKTAMAGPEQASPLTRIRNSRDIPRFATSVMEILGIEDEELGGAVKYSLVELLRNVVQHSRSPVDGLAMAQ